MSKIQMCLEIEQAIKALNLPYKEIEKIRMINSELEAFHEALGKLFEDKIMNS